MNIISEVLSASVSSAKSKPLRLVERGGKIYEIRGPLHILLLMPFGSGKSSQLVKMKGKEVFNVTDYKLPGIVGTISRDGEYLPGAAELGAGKSWRLDECHNLTDSGRNAMLKLLEGEEYARNIGFKLRSKLRKNRKYFKMTAMESYINVWSQFSCIASGLYVGRKRMNDLAWLSRFMPLKLKLNIEEAYDMSAGRQLFEAKYNPYVETPLFETYMKFWKAHKETVLSLKEDNIYLYNFLAENYGFLRRSIVDFCRIFSYDSRGNSVIDDWEKYIPYIRVFLYNYATATLTLTEFEILDCHGQGISQKEIAIKVGRSENHVSAVMKKLRGIGLVV